MMRPSFLIASLVSVGALGYFFGPDLAELGRPKVPAGELAQALPESLKRRDASTFEVRSPRRAPSREVAPARPARLSAAPGAKGAKEGRLTSAPGPKPSHGESRNEPGKMKERGGRRLAPMVTTQGGRSTAQQPTRAGGVTPGSVAALKNERWLASLSGPDARLGMKLRSRTMESCSTHAARCQERVTPKDLSLTGVVVETESLASRPAEVVEGQVRAGHYLDETPALYVK